MDRRVTRQCEQSVRTEPVRARILRYVTELWRVQIWRNRRSKAVNIKLVKKWPNHRSENVVTNQFTLSRQRNCDELDTKIEDSWHTKFWRDNSSTTDACEDERMQREISRLEGEFIRRGRGSKAVQAVSQTVYRGTQGASIAVSTHRRQNAVEWDYFNNVLLNFALHWFGVTQLQRRASARRPCSRSLVPAFSRRWELSNIGSDHLYSLSTHQSDDETPEVGRHFYKDRRSNVIIPKCDVTVTSARKFRFLLKQNVGDSFPTRMISLMSLRFR